MSSEVDPAQPAPGHKAKVLLQQLFQRADIQINGARPFDIQVKDPRFYSKAIRFGDLGIGEAYVDGWWECDAIDEMASRFIMADLNRSSHFSLPFILYYFETVLSGIGRKGKAFEVGQHHYDMGNDLFKAMLDERMVYSCAYWKNANTLEQAQKNKLDLVCRKADLKPGMRVLDIGCGWGSWSRYAAENYGVEVVGLTVSREQMHYAQSMCAGLPVEFRLQDYRDIDEQFDRVVSIAMFEAVGHRYYGTFMQTVERCLHDDGLFVLHTILAQTHQGPEQARWLNEYIFPNGELPSLAQIMASVERIFVVEHAHHLDGDYEKTLEAWYQNFLASWPELKENYDDHFFRMWTFYLRISKGIFLSRLGHVWQFVFSKRGVPGRIWPYRQTRTEDF
jgi:cyclopropane-fatty-acyl-phospholipid synthase